MKQLPSKKVASFNEDNLKVFYYLSASEIRPSKMVAFGGNCLIRWWSLVAEGGLLHSD